MGPFRELVETLIVPPPMPPIGLPWPMRVTGSILSEIKQVCLSFFWAGVSQGAIWGFVGGCLAMFFVLAKAGMLRGDRNA